MRTRLWILSVCATVAFTSAFRADAAEQLHLIEHALTDTTTDLGAKGDSVGDLLTFANQLYAADDRTKMGDDQGFCIRVVAGKSWECFWTAMLKGGHITVEGPYYDHGDSVLTITGGTGQYVGARGSMRLHARDRKGSAYDFFYRLL